MNKHNDQLTVRGVADGRFAVIRPHLLVALIAVELSGVLCVIQRLRFCTPLVFVQMYSLGKAEKTGKNLFFSI